MIHSPGGQEVPTGRDSALLPESPPHPLGPESQDCCPPAGGGVLPADKVTGFSGAWASGRGSLRPWTPPRSGPTRAGTEPQQPCLSRRPVLGTWAPSSGAPPSPRPLPSLPLLPSSGPQWGESPSKAASRRGGGTCGTQPPVRRAGRAAPGPPSRGGVGQGPPGPPLVPLSTEKYLPRAGGGLAGPARKGRGGGQATGAPALAMYWMKST